MYFCLKFGYKGRHKAGKRPDRSYTGHTQVRQVRQVIHRSYTGQTGHTQVRQVTHRSDRSYTGHTQVIHRSHTDQTGHTQVRQVIQKVGHRWQNIFHTELQKSTINVCDDWCNFIRK